MKNKSAQQVALAYQGRDVQTNISEAQVLREKGALTSDERVQREGLTQAIVVQATEVGMSDTDIGRYMAATEKVKTATGSDKEVLLQEIAEFEAAIARTSQQLYGWTNPFNELYALNQEINAEMRERERLEKQYQILLEFQNATGKELGENQKQQLLNLKQQAETQKQIFYGLFCKP